MTRPASRLWPSVLLLLALLLALGLGSLGYQRLHRAALADLTLRGESTLSLAVAALYLARRRHRQDVAPFNRARRDMRADPFADARDQRCLQPLP